MLRCNTDCKFLLMHLLDIRISKKKKLDNQVILSCFKLYMGTLNSQATFRRRTNNIRSKDVFQNCSILSNLKGNKTIKWYCKMFGKTNINRCYIIF